MQFDVHRNLGRGREVAPFLVDLQQVEIEQLRTTVVAPLVSDLLFKAHPRLTPGIAILGTRYFLSMPELFSIERRLLGPSVQNIAAFRHLIVGAIDLLFTGV